MLLHARAGKCSVLGKVAALTARSGLGRPRADQRTSPGGRHASLQSRVAHRRVRRAGTPRPLDKEHCEYGVRNLRKHETAPCSLEFPGQNGLGAEAEPLVNGNWPANLLCHVAPAGGQLAQDRAKRAPEPSWSCGLPKSQKGRLLQAAGQGGWLRYRPKWGRSALPAVVQVVGTSLGAGLRRGDGRRR